MPCDETLVATLSIPPVMTTGVREQFLDDLRTSLTNPSNTLTLECSAVEVVTSMHISLLWEARRACDDEGVALQLHHPTGAMRRVLRVMDLDTFFDVAGETESSNIRDSLPQDYSHGPDFEDRIVPTLDGVQESLARFIMFLADLAVTSDDAYQLQTAYYEIAANIVSHGNLRTDAMICVHAAAAPDHLVIEFRDNGQPFDPTAFRHCDDFRAAAKRGATRGLGIGMVHRLVDRMEYHSDDDMCNVVSITKKWSHPNE